MPDTAKPTHFDIVKQSDQILVRVSLHGLLKLSLTTREALREVLADAEIFITQLAEPSQQEVLQIGERHNLITFSYEDMLICGMHERPLYLIGCIGSSQINHIQIDLGSSY